MLRIHQRQQWIYTSFFLFTLGFCTNTLGAGECPISLERECSGEHDFLAACREGNVAAVNYFLSLEGFDINEQFISGATGKPIHGLFLAAQNGHAEVVRVLVNDFNIDIDKTWQHNATSLFQAAQEGHPEVVKCLLDAGADPLQKLRRCSLIKKSPLMAAKQGRPFLRICNPEKWDRYSTIIAMLEKAIRRPSADDLATTDPNDDSSWLEKHPFLKLMKSSK
ncbi:ankyrin repeat domain-containing protein [Sansalvadorimonas verongulae]|uniref:ankyrin repeat domain-containing protein n=1 Tax=Sansalvadorimonas verongulae TaxID=2172824 RepID=UPI0012BBDDBD|nr:ankyrin repeat domain-containing protein [Sansalvadorimonas verongulae]MTI12020.1 hypothetical protein [Sansalvadorimonas verongulae]